jgi:hypothetical protein
MTAFRSAAVAQLGADRSRIDQATRPGHCPVADETSPSDADFIAICAAYRGQGGIARSTELAECLLARPPQGTHRLEALIVAGAIFSFEWNHACWVPMFQFGPERGPLPRAAVAAVLAELAPLFDGWRLALWFAQPNAWLREQRPFELLDADLDGVLATARADRYIAQL